MTPHRLTQSRRAATVPTRVTHSPAPSIGGHRAGGIRPNRGRTATPPIARAPIRGLAARPKQASRPHGGPRARSRPTRYPQPAVRRSKSIPPPGPRTHKPAPPTPPAPTRSSSLPTRAHGSPTGGSLKHTYITARNGRAGGVAPYSAELRESSSIELPVVGRRLNATPRPAWCRATPALREDLGCGPIPPTPQHSFSPTPRAGRGKASERPVCAMTGCFAVVSRTFNGVARASARGGR